MFKKNESKPVKEKVERKGRGFYSTSFYLLSFALFLLINGCSSLPSTVAVSVPESLDVTERFKEMVARQIECHCCIDARAVVSFKSIWDNGTISGYLQAMSPSYLKFVGVNPFGMPLAILVTDGDTFRYVTIPEKKGYEGGVSGATFTKYAPEGFLPEHGFYWLIGRLYPGTITIADVNRDEEDMGYWFNLDYGHGAKSLVLFDKNKDVLLRHIVINEQEEKILDISYGLYQPGPCPIPGEVIVSSLVHGSTLTMKLSDWLPEPTFSKQDFHYNIPAGFERVTVK